MIKKILLRAYNFPFLSKEKIDVNQKKIREIEWDSIKNYIVSKSKFLDVGCGAGYAMHRAKADFGCDCYGIDPEPGAHGVGLYTKDTINNLNIQKGFSEHIPFASDSFDVVYCSHVLEHVSDMSKSLTEMKRVLKENGILIIGVPTAIMACISFITQMLFTTHTRIVNVLMKPFIATGEQKFIHIFLPPSHSDFNKTVLYDLKHYRVKNWERIISSQFVIKKTILPCLYPLPDYIQLFKMRKIKNFSSSVLFVCKRPSG